VGKQKSKRVLERGVNDIYEWLGILVYSLKGSGVWKIR